MCARNRREGLGIDSGMVKHGFLILILRDFMMRSTRAML
jgi:hypothetical protein